MFLVVLSVRGESLSEDQCCGLELNCNSANEDENSMEAQCCSAGYDCAAFEERSLTEAGPSDGPSDSTDAPVVTAAPSSGPSGGPVSVTTTDTTTDAPGPPDDDPVTGVTTTAGPERTVRFTITVSADGFDHTNEAHVAAFKRGVLSALQLTNDVPLENVALVFEHTGSLRRLATEYTVTVTITLPENMDVQLVRGRVRNDTMRQTLQEQIVAEFNDIEGVSGWAVTNVTPVEGTAPLQNHAGKQFLSWVAIAAMIAKMI